MSCWWERSARLRLPTRGRLGTSRFLRGRLQTSPPVVIPSSPIHDGVRDTLLSSTGRCGPSVLTRRCNTPVGERSRYASGLTIPPPANLSAPLTRYPARGGWSAHRNTSLQLTAPGAAEEVHPVASPGPTRPTQPAGALPLIDPTPKHTYFRWLATTESEFECGGSFFPWWVSLSCPNFCWVFQPQRRRRPRWPSSRLPATTRVFTPVGCTKPCSPAELMMRVSPTGSGSVEPVSMANRWPTG